jgi:quercetin dioxygenase-like cupin family protein
MQLIRNSDVPAFELEGASVAGLAVPSRGSRQYEVWWFSLEPGAVTPLHRHDCEEIVVYLKGRGEAREGEETLTVEAPCTLILAPQMLHGLTNTGTERIEGITMLGARSRMWNAEGEEMVLPWR